VRAGTRHAAGPLAGGQRAALRGPRRSVRWCPRLQRARAPREGPWKSPRARHMRAAALAPPSRARAGSSPTITRPISPEPNTETEPCARSTSRCRASP
jgi:hypothetical protein